NGAEENRLMADLADAAKSPSVLQWRIRVVQLDPTNLKNYLAWANSELELGEPEMALQALRQAPAGAKVETAKFERGCCRGNPFCGSGENKTGGSAHIATKRIL